MPNRIPDINSDIYTECNPEGIISAKKGAWFFRRDKNFYINHQGDEYGEWVKLPYTTVTLSRPNPNKIIIYSHRFQLWEKMEDGIKIPWIMGDREVSYNPKMGWKSISYEDAFMSIPDPRPFNWIFPPPASSYDPRGSDKNRSYDENFFYAKTASVWYRTPITLYTFAGNPSGENANLQNNLPFVVVPRATPVPSSSYQSDSVKPGDQTYDADFFYIKPSVWKRSALSVYSPSQMTIF